MQARRVRMILGVWMGLFLLVVGGLGGMAIERMQFEPQRTAILEHLEEVVRRHEATVMAFKPGARAGAPAPERHLGGRERPRPTMSSSRSETNIDHWYSLAQVDPGQSRNQPATHP
jgi:hypothetical protein